MSNELKKIKSETTLATTEDVANAVSGVAHLGQSETFTGVKTYNKSIYVGDGNLNNIIVTSGDIRKMTDGSVVTYDFPASGGTLALSSEIPTLRYSITTPEQTTSGTTISLTLADHAINQVELASTVTEATVSFPPKVVGYARDLFVRLTILGTTVPAITWQESNGDAIDFDVDDNSWAEIESGVNILMFTETSQSVS